MADDPKPPTSSKKILVGTQLYGWGQAYAREGKRLDDHLDDVLGAVRDAGFDYAEGFLDVAQPENNARFAERAKAKGLKSVCIYTGGKLHDAGADKSIEQIVAAAKVCRKVGYVVLNCNPDPIGREKNDAELATQIKSLDKLGRTLLDLGMLLGVHNHTPEMVNKAREFHANLRQTNHDAVGFCFDVDWVHRGGVAPLSALHEYHDRVVSWHLRQSQDGIWTEDLADGDIDYKPIVEFARQHDMIAPLTVELAIEKGTKLTRTAAENNRRSREYVRKTFGV